MLPRAGEAAQYEYHFRTLTGQDRWTLHDSFLDSDPDTGEPIIHAMVQDITEKKLAVMEIEQSRARLSELIQRLVDVRQQERAQLAEALHDGIGQNLFALRLHLQSLARPGIDCAWWRDSVYLQDLGRARLEGLPPVRGGEEERMAITSSQSGTNVHEIADGIYRINTPVVIDAGGTFSFNQYLIRDDESLIFHTGPRRMFPLVREAVASVMPVEQLRYIAFSHVEADECGSLNEWLAASPQSVPLCGTVAALVSINDLADRAPRALADGEMLSLGRHRLRWFDTPHLPHAWECGFLMEETTRTLLCGDLFTQGGSGAVPVTEADILGPSEAFRAQMDYFSHTTNARTMLERLASADPANLACMHGSAWHGDGGRLLRALADALAP